MGHTSSMRAISLTVACRFMTGDGATSCTWAPPTSAATAAGATSSMRLEASDPVSATRAAGATSSMRAPPSSSTRAAGAVNWICAKPSTVATISSTGEGHTSSILFRISSAKSEPNATRCQSSLSTMSFQSPGACGSTKATRAGDGNEPHSSGASQCAHTMYSVPGSTVTVPRSYSAGLAVSVAPEALPL